MQILNIEFDSHRRDFEYRPKTEEILNSKIVGLQKVYFASKKINRIFKDEVDFTKLMDCFDYDKMCLLICYSMLKQGVSERTGSICPSMFYCLNYFSAIQEYLKYDVNYNPTILVYDKNKGKNIEISLNELYEEYKKILSKHPEYEYSDLDNNGMINIFNEIIKYVEENNINELNNREFTEILRMLLFKNNYEKVSESEIKHNIEDLDSLSKDETSNEKKNRIKQQIEKMEFLLNNNPVDCIKGKGTFENYYGYIYPNGYIVFDTLDKDFNKSYGNAMFAMPVYLIDDLSEIKKRELITNHSEVITAIVHRGNWKEKILDLLNKKNIADFDYDKTSTFDVSEIIDKDELEKLREIEEKINNARSENEKQELKKEYKIVKRKAQLEKIDSELKSNEFDKYEIYPEESRQKVEQLDGEKEDVLNSQDIEEMANSDKSFEELYEEWKKNHEKKKKARNPVVAAITKRRSMNENGRYCCEWCGKDYLNTSPLRSHHVRPLSQGGPDNIYNTVCICPDCHDYVHSHEITDEEQYRLFEIVRKHIEEENPEYLPDFNEMMSPIAKDDEDYMKNKAIIDRNFELQWNDVNIRKR